MGARLDPRLRPRVESFRTSSASRITEGMPPNPPIRWPLLLALAASACQRPSASHAPDAAEAVASRDEAEAEPAAPAPAADPTHPLELVPARARVMVMARSPQRLAQVWERERIAGRFPEHYDRLTFELRQALGRDLLDPDELAAMGIDPTAPAGMAVLSFEDEAVVLFGGTSDPQRLLDELGRLATKGSPPGELRTVGEARLLPLGPDATLVLRHGMFALVVVDVHRQGTTDYARDVARIDPAQSLAHAHTMQRAHAGLPQQADVQGLLDVAGLVHDALERSRRFDQEALASASQQLAEARQRGATAEQIAELQRSLQEQQAFNTRRQRERQIGELLLSRTLGAIESIGLAVDADEHGLRGRVHVGLAPDAAFRELFVSSPQPPSAIAALAEAPQLVLSARLDVGVAIDLFAQAALAVGSSYAEANDELRDDTRLDFDRELRPLLDGRATFVLTAGPPPEPRTVDDAGFTRTLGGIVALGVSDEAKARAALDELVQRWPEQAWTPAPEIGGHSITPRKWDRPLWVGVVAGQLVASTDLAALRRMRDGQAGPASTLVPDPEAWQRLTEGPGVGRLALHHRLPLAAASAFLMGFDSFDFPRGVDDELRLEFPDEDVFAIPHGAATKALEKKRDRAWVKKVELRRKRSAERQLLRWNHAQALGLTAGVVRGVDSGLMIEGGHYVAGGVGGYVDAVIDLVDLESTARTSVDAELERATKRQEQADQRLLEARRKEIRTAIAKRKGPR